MGKFRNFRRTRVTQYLSRSASQKDIPDSLQSWDAELHADRKRSPVLVSNAKKALGWRLACLSLVIALHVGLIAISLKTSAHSAIPTPPSVIHASLISKAAEPAAVQKEKTPPPAAKPKIKQRTMIAAPKPAAEAAEPAALAETPEAPSTESPHPEARGEFVEARADADYLSNPAPEYPRLSKRNREEGKVMLRVFVEKNGKPSTVTLHSSSGFERLDQAAMDAVRAWSFVPAKQGDEIVAAWVLVPIAFHLRG
jgi:protein TonB